MAYVGTQPVRGQYRKLTNISSSFNGVTTTFTTSVPPGTSDYYVTAGSASQLLVSLGGVIQQPDVDYTVSTNSITFTTAPAAGLSFFGVLMGDTLNSVTPSDGSITTAKLAGNLSVGLTGGSAAAPSLFFTGDSNNGIYSPGADTLAISTNGSQRVTVDSSGRVGIGTGSPGTALQVVGTGRYTSGTESTQIYHNGTVGYIETVGNSTTALGFANGGTEKARIDSSGRLLVGTSTASQIGPGITALTQIEGGSTTALSIFSNANDTGGGYITLGKSRGTSVGSNTIVANGDELGGIYFAGADGSDRTQSAASIICNVDATPGINDMPGRLVFSVTRDGQASPTEAARINNAGFSKFSNAGSYSNAAGSFHEFRSDVGGIDAISISSTHASNPYGLSVTFPSASPNNGVNYFIYCSDSTAQRASIRSNGGLANYQANNVNLSDRNTKKDISPAAGTWDCIKEWEIVNYRYKDQPADTDLNLGVIAQQVAESCPEVITVFEEAKDDQPEKLGVKEQQMYWMAIKALQEAQIRIETLEAEVAALKAQ